MIKDLCVELPKSVHKKTIVFDLDETLVHCETKNLEKAEIPLFVDIINGDEKQVHKVLKN